MSESLAHVLIVDDDAVFGAVLARALKARGYAVSVATNTAGALACVSAKSPTHAVVDLKLGAESGLSLIPRLLERVPSLRILLLTGYASIATAVEAIKRGAHDYLAKPVDADAVVKALLSDSDEADTDNAAAVVAPPLKRLEWEHIQRALADAGGNVSEAARRLGLHRRTLQRKLVKRPVREHPDN